MFTPLHNEMADALKDLRAKQEEIAAAITRMQEATATATTRDRTIKATVDGQGRLTELAFNGQRWRDMAPKELCAKIVEVVADAQKQASEAAGEAMAGLVPDGLDLDRLREVGPDLEAMMNSAIADAGRWSR